MQAISKRIALVRNPGAGRGEDTTELRAMIASAFDVLDFETDDSCDADTCTRKALDENVGAVLAAGGDGTVSKVASALVGTGVPLGILPLGTANSIAAGLGIPADIGAAMQIVNEGVSRVIDTAEVNGQTMVLHSSLGLHAATIAETSRESKNRWGVLAYLATALEAIGKQEPFEVEISTEFGTFRCSANNLTVANIAPIKTVLAQGPAEVLPDDGRLDLTVVSANSFTEAVAAGFHLLKTAIAHQPAAAHGVGFLRARSFIIRPTPAQPILIDGEEAGSGSLVVECRPSSLRVLVPAASQPDTQ